MIYLDNAAGSHPKPKAVTDAIYEACDKYGANPGRGSYALTRATSAMVSRSREKLAALFGCAQAERLIFTAGATVSLNMALFGLLKQGDHLIISGMEHNAMWRPAMALEKAGVITVTRVAADKWGLVRAEDFAAAIRPQTALLACVHASNVNGAIQPIAKIGRLAKMHGLPLLVDAAQSAGLLDIDVQRDNISLLAFAGHKYLYGTAGTGGLYVAPELRMSSFIYGGTGNNSEQRDQPDFYPDHLEAGSLNTAGIAALAAGVDFVGDIGIAEMYGRGKELTDMLMEKLSVIKKVNLQTPLHGVPYLPLVSFTVEGKTATEIAGLLDCRFDIAVRSGYHCAPLAHRSLETFSEGSVRISPGYFNTAADMEKTAVAVAALAK